MSKGGKGHLTVLRWIGEHIERPRIPSQHQGSIGHLEWMRRAVARSIRQLDSIVHCFIVSKR